MKITTETIYKEWEGQASVLLQVEVDGIPIGGPIVIFSSNNKHDAIDLFQNKITLKELYDKGIIK